MTKTRWARCVLALTLGIAGCLGVDPARLPHWGNNDPFPTDELGAVKYLTNLGGTVVRQTTNPELPVLFVDLHETSVTDRDLSLLRYFPHLQRLNLYKTAITDAGMAELAEA